jgi:hypothetical protein
MSMHSRTNIAINKTNQNRNNLRNSSVLNSLSNNTPNNRSNNSMPNSRSNNSSMPSSNSTRLSRALKSSSASSRVHGSSTVPKTGSQTTAPGNNVGATAVIASLTIGTMDTLGLSMGSESMGFRFWWLVDTQGFSTRVIGLVLLTHGRGPGQITGMTPMTSMFLTSTTGTTCITAGIPGLELPSAFQCSGPVGAVTGDAAESVAQGRSICLRSKELSGLYGNDSFGHDERKTERSERPTDRRTK